MKGTKMRYENSTKTMKREHKIDFACLYLGI